MIPIRTIPFTETFAFYIYVLLPILVATSYILKRVLTDVFKASGFFADFVAVLLPIMSYFIYCIYSHSTQEILAPIIFIMWEFILTLVFLKAIEFSIKKKFPINILIIISILMLFVFFLPRHYANEKEFGSCYEGIVCQQCIGVDVSTIAHSEDCLGIPLSCHTQYSKGGCIYAD